MAETKASRQSPSPSRQTGPQLTDATGSGHRGDDLANPTPPTGLGSPGFTLESNPVHPLEAAARQKAEKTMKPTGSGKDC